MVLARAGVAAVGGGRTIDALYDEASYRDACDNRSLTAGIAGTCVAILTFALFFLYPRWQSSWQNEPIDNALFQFTLFDIVAALFLISLASMNFWFVMETIRSNSERTAWYFHQAEVFFGVGFVLFLLEPALILVTVGLYYAAAFAFGLWAVLLLSLGRGWRTARARTPT